VDLRAAELAIVVRIAAAAQRVLDVVEARDQPRVLRVVTGELLTGQEPGELVVGQRHRRARLESGVADEQTLGRESRFLRRRAGGGVAGHEETRRRDADGPEKSPP